MCGGGQVREDNLDIDSLCGGQVSDDNQGQKMIKVADGIRMTQYMIDKDSREILKNN